MMKTIQVEANKNHSDNNLIKSCGVKRIHSGWYTLWYNGVMPDFSNVVRVERNRGGKIKC